MFSIVRLCSPTPGGLRRGNVSRDIRRLCEADLMSLDLYDCMIPIFNVKKKPIAMKEEVVMPMILPHEFLGWMFRQHPHMFRLHVLGGRSPSSIASFWEGFKDDDELIWSHPVFHGDYDLEMLCPLGGHSDGVPVTRAGAPMGLFVTSVSSPLSIGKTLDSHWLSCVLPNTITIKQKPRQNLSADGFWPAWNWSMSALASGKYPSHDHDQNAFPSDSPRGILAGQDIAGGMKFLNFQHRGDLDMACNDLGLSHWSCVESPCGRCPCNATDMFRFEPGVAWKRRCYTRHTFKPPPSPFWQGPGVSLRTHCLDPAHMLDKGISMNMLGSLFKNLVWEKTCKSWKRGEQRGDLVEPHTGLLRAHRIRG